jgi:hypothetical protein
MVVLGGFCVGCELMAWLKRFWWAVAVGVIVVVGLGIFLAIPDKKAQTVLPPTRARVYTAQDACLLTDASGVTGAAAVPVWKGMQAASTQTSAKVSFLAVSGPDTAANSVAYVNTLVQRKCTIVLAVGNSQVAAVQEQAKTYPSIRFALIGGGGKSSNMWVVARGSDDDVAVAVRSLIVQFTSH